MTLINHMQEEFKRRSALFGLLLLWIWSPVTLYSQQVYPVTISGSLLPPNSRSLYDYTTGVATDIMVIATLRDPIEISRVVKFKFTILHEGQEVMITNPNYNPSPIRLDKDVSMNLFGSDLTEYFTPAAMMNPDGSTAGLLLEDGINSICVEVIDVERNVPISERFCMTGFFKNAEPPLLVVPECDRVIPWTETQNILFNWILPPSPLDGSIMVEYEFTLTRVFVGQNPYEAFLPAQIVFQDVTTTPSYAYLEGQSQLEPGITYAWRIRARDAMGSDLFDNNGYSPVCTFSILAGEEDELKEDYSCNNGPCYWNGPTNNTDLSASPQQNDVLKIGLFEMQLLEDPIGDYFGYSGTGTITIPFLYARVKVEFDNIRINEDGRVYAGDITTIEPEPGVIPPLFSILDPTAITDALDSLSAQFPDDVAFTLNETLEPTVVGAPNLHLVSELKKIAEENRPILAMPLGIDQIGVNNKTPLNVAITGIRFAPDQAVLNAVLAIKNGADWIKFGIKSLCLQPGGLAFAGDARLDLLNDVRLKSIDESITLLGLTPEDDGTYLTWDCNGFKEFFVKGQYRFDDEYINLTNPGEPVIAAFTSSTMDLDDIIAEVEPVDRFTVEDMGGFEFEISQSVGDFSVNRNSENMEWPDRPEYEEIGDQWVGLYVNSVEVILPDALRFSDEGNASISGQNILIDSAGVTGMMGLRNFIQSETDHFGGWGLTVDSLGMTFFQSTFEEGYMDGGIKLPLLNDPITYAGLLLYEDVYNDGEEHWVTRLKLKEDQIMAMSLGPSDSNSPLAEIALRSEVESGNGTEIRAVYDAARDTFDVSATICGGVTLSIFENNFRSSGVPNIVIDLLKELVGEDITFGARFDLCLGMDPSLKMYDGAYFKPEAGPIELSLGNQNVNLSDVFDLLEIEFQMPAISTEIPNLDFKVPGFPDFPNFSVNLNKFPDVSFPTMSSLPGYPSMPKFEIPNFPSIRMPDFRNFNKPEFPELPKISMPSFFKTLGFNFNFNLKDISSSFPSVDVGISSWVYAKPTTGMLPDYDFASFEIKLPSLSLSCMPDEPETFEISDSLLTVQVDFLDYEFNIEPVELSEPLTYRSTSVEESYFEGFDLRSALDKMLTSDPVKIFIGDRGENFVLPFNVAVTGMTFNSETNLATLNFEMSIKIDGKDYTLVGAVPMDNKGFYADGLKLGFKN